MSKKLIAKSSSSYDSDEDEGEILTLRELSKKIKKIEAYLDRRVEKIETQLFELQAELMTLIKDMVGVVSEEAKKNEKKRVLEHVKNYEEEGEKGELLEHSDTDSINEIQDANQTDELINKIVC